MRADQRPRRADDPVIVAARRTPIGQRGGALADLHPHRMLGVVQRAVLADVSVPADRVGAVLTGCVTQVGDQSYNIGRMASLAEGLPSTVPAMTLDAQCGSSHQAVNLAATMVRSGTAEVVLAGGVETMSRVPLGSAQKAGWGDPYSAGFVERYEVVGQGESAERIADLWGISRSDCDQWAARSQDRAGQATVDGRFADEIVPITLDGRTMTDDEGLRASTAETLARLRPAFRPNGRHTAGNSSQISDGAAAVLIMSRAYADRAGLEPLATVADQSFVGVDPALKLTGPIPATAEVLERSEMVAGDIGVFEVSEAFAAVVLAWLAETGADPDRVNVSGGAIALGHPVGASGARMITTAVHHLRRTDAESAIVTMCCGGGLGTATLLIAEDR